MNHKSLVDNVAEKFELKRNKSRKIVDHILTELIESGLSGEGFSSPILRVTSREVEKKVVETPEGTKVIPAKQLMRLAKSKPYVSASDSVDNSNLQVTSS